MKFKQYLQYVAVHVPADSERPTDIVQSLSCLIAERLSTTGKLPVSCGVGDELDMDIVQAGLLAGLERIKAYDAALGTMRQFLYPTIAGAMRDYAWERENRVSDSRPDEAPQAVAFTDKDEEDAATEPALVNESTPETMMIAEQAGTAALERITAAVGSLGTDGAAMLLRDAQIGYDAAKRLEWAAEIGVSLGALNVRLSRLRRDARDWALNVH